MARQTEKLKLSTMKKYYLFTQTGTTDRFFCGEIYEAQPTEETKISGYDELMAFETAEELEHCKSFATMAEAKEYGEDEYTAMIDSNHYAEIAMECESYYECEGVDDMRFE